MHSCVYRVARVRFMRQPCRLVDDNRLRDESLR
jgi:hypothetical protein